MESKAKLASCYARLGTIKLQCPRHSMMFAGTFEQTQNVESIHTSNLVKIFQFHSKLGNGCFTSFFDGILLSVRLFISSTRLVSEALGAKTGSSGQSLS